MGSITLPREGRYNKKEAKALYLIDHIEFLSREIGEKEMLVQEYRINLSSIHVADLSPKNASISNSLSLLFQAAERGKTGSGFDFETELVRLGRSKYLISQLISAMFMNQDWQGLYVPGVHGKQENYYMNLAILGDCVDRWKDWTIGEYRIYSDGTGWLS
jgi:RES domain-containing protein